MIISHKIKDHVINKVSPKDGLLKEYDLGLKTFEELSKDFEYLLE